MIAAGLLLFAAAAAPVPPPVEQLTANCAAPVYASDMLVCADAELAAADAALAAAVAARLTGDAGDAFRAEQAKWFRDSRRCAFEAAHRACLVEAYRARLAAIGGPPLAQ